MEFVYLITGLAIGFVLAWFIRKPQQGALANTEETALLRTQVQEATNEGSALKSANQHLAAERDRMYAEMKQQQEQIIRITNEHASAVSNNKNLEQKLHDQKQEIETLNGRMKLEFENLANKILEEKSQKFTDQNRVSLDQVLSPLKDRIKDFEEKVQRHYDEENREKASLKREIQQVFELNQQMSRETQNLTRALKGENKTQGNWGEFILESVLERSGLVKDNEYFVQQSFTTEDGRRLQPDVIVRLPEGKSIIIDSKVVLTAYERFYAADDDAAKAVAIKEHVNALRTHIKGLGEKNYQNLYQVKSLDFVLLFIPVEPAFALAVQNDPQVFSEAFDKNIVIVSPSTLLATLRTVASIWRQENHNRNAFEIAKKAGDLYDKFTGFVEDMLDLGRKMDQSKNSYIDAMKKLSEGRGNLVNRVQDLKKMGAITSKNIPPALIERASDPETEQ